MHKQVHTMTYQNIPVHTSAYQNIPVHASSDLGILGSKTCNPVLNPQCSACSLHACSTERVHRSNTGYATFYFFVYLFPFSCSCLSTWLLMTDQHCLSSSALPPAITSTARHLTIAHQSPHIATGLGVSNVQVDCTATQKYQAAT
jgi:hypothetical protein